VDTVRLANGEQQMTTVHRARYKVAASNRRGGRSLSIDRLILDELREHHDWSAWNAAVPAMNARPNAQVFAISNQGDDAAVVLESLRSSALTFIDTGEGDPRLGLFEWSAPDGCDVDDLGRSRRRTRTPVGACTGMTCSARPGARRPPAARRRPASGPRSCASGCGC
jgi:phage terminase large subunit-like protein